MSMASRLWKFALAWAAIIAAAPASAAEPVPFYRGKTIQIIVSSPVGGGYDAMSRVIARHLPAHILGRPNVIVINMPGAGGIAATNHLYSRAAKDGTVIGGVQNNTPFEPLMGTTQAVYDATKFNWLGSPSIETGIVAVWHTVPVTTIDDLKKHEVLMGSSGANSTPSFYARLINATMGTKMKLIVGYPGQTEALNATERGELDGYPSIFYSSIMTTKPDWVRDKKLKFLLQYGPHKEPALQNVPFAMDLVTNPADRVLLQTGFAALSLGRPYLMPPGVPPERVALMRKALAETFADPRFIAEATRMGLAPNQARTGEQLQQILEQTYRTPPAVIDRLRKLVHG